MKSPINTRDITVPEEIINKWQSIVNITAEIIGVPAALIMKGEPPNVEVFVSNESSNNPYKVGSREHLAGLYCETVIATRDKLLVPDASEEREGNKNPDITLGMISYLGFPLLWPNGEVFGTICVLDSKENGYGERYEKLMLQFKEVIEAHLALLYQAQLFNNQASEVKRIEGGDRALFEQSLQGLVIVQDNKIAFANSATAEILGYSFEELMSLSSEETMALVHPEDQRFVWGGYQERLEGRTVPRRYECRVIRKDGTERWVEMFANRIEYRGKPAVQAAVVDITERKEAEEALRESEELFRLAFENANIGMCLVDIDGRLTKVNRQMCEIFGYSQEELESMTVNDIAHPEDLDISPQFIQRSLSGEVEYAQFEKRYFHKQGHTIWGQVSSSLVRDSQAAPTYFISHVQNTTERKRVEDLLRAQRDLGLALSAASGLDETLRLCLETAIHCSGMDCGGVYLVDESSGDLDLAFQKGLTPDFVERVSNYDACSANARLVMAGKAIYTRFQELGVPLDQPERNEGLRAIAVIPVRSEDRVIGCLNIASHTLDEIPDFARTALETIANQIGDAIIRSKMEEALCESEERFRAISEAIPVPIMISRKSDSVILYTNEHLGELLGLHPSQLIGRKTVDFFYDLADRQVIRNTVQREGYVRSYEFRAKRADGTPFWVVTSSQPLVFRGEQAYLSGFYEITERKRAEEELRAAEEKYRVLVENANEAVIVAQDDMLRFVNPKTIEITGYSKEELTSRPFVGFIHPDDREIVVERHLRRLKGKEVPDVYPFRIIDKEGNIKWLEINAVLINWEGRPATLNFLTDITERKRAEEELRESEERFRTSVTNTPIGLSIIGKDGTYEYVNPKFVEMFGYTPEDVPTGKEWFERAYPDPVQRQKVIACWIGDLKEAKVGETRHRVFTVTCKDGSKKEISFRPVSLTDRRQLVTYEDITERVRAEERLQQSEEKYRTLVEHSLQGLNIIQGIPPRLVFVNSSMAEIFGYTVEEVLSLSAEETRGLVHPEDQGFVWERYRDRLAGKTVPSRYEYRGVRKDGTVRWLEVFSSRIEFRGEPAVQAVLADITERKRAEEVLKESEEKFRNLAEQSPNMIFINQRGRVVYANKKCEDIMGYTRDEFYSPDFDFLSLIAPESTELVISSFARHMKGEEIEPYEYSLVTKDGERIEAILNTTLINYQGERAILGTITDITERKRAEQRLREYEARYSHLLDHMPDGVALTQRGRIIRVNPSMARMFGFPSPEKIEGLYIWDLAAHGSKGFMRQQSTLRALGQQGKNRFEFQALRKNGRTFPAEVTFTVDRSEPQPFVLSVIRDVTERKTSEDQRKLLSDRIITAGERERALIARELHDELGQALTGIKIDMAWIRSHVKGTDTAVSDRFNALEGLINTTIETVRKMAASLRPSMLDQLGLAAAIEWYAGEFERRTGIECIIESETPDFNIKKKTAINAYRIYQEALTNVARHAKASRVDVRIDQDRGYLTLCISDNGRGIPSQRLSGPISPLGIAGMRERAELVKGRLDIRSQRGKGTEVTAYLPLSPQRG